MWLCHGGLCWLLFTSPLTGKSWASPRAQRIWGGGVGGGLWILILRKSTSLALLPGLNLSPCLRAFNMATPSPCHSPASKSSMAPSWLEFKILNTLCICVRPTHALQNDQKILGVAFCPFECYSEHNTQMRLSSAGVKTVVLLGAGTLVRYCQFRLQQASFMQGPLLVRGRRSSTTVYPGETVPLGRLT